LRGGRSAVRRQFRSAFGLRSLDGAATEVSLELVVVVVVDGMVDEVLPLLVAGVVACELSLVEGAVEFIVESAGRVAGSLVVCA
jgi:hypothetical protein